MKVALINLTSNFMLLLFLYPPLYLIPPSTSSTFFLTPFFKKWHSPLFQPLLPPIYPPPPTLTTSSSPSWLSSSLPSFSSSPKNQNPKSSISLQVPQDGLLLGTYSKWLAQGNLSLNMLKNSDQSMDQSSLSKWAQEQ